MSGAWQADGLTVSTDPAQIHPPVTFTTRPRPDLFANIDDVRAAITDDAVCICETDDLFFAELVGGAETNGENGEGFDTTELTEA